MTDGMDWTPANAPGMDELDRLLGDTSRTFALAIPLLEGELRREVTVAYLLFRIADTFEDSETWAPEERVAALREFVHLLRAPDAAAARRLGEEWARRTPVSHAGYLDLLRRTDRVLETYRTFRPSAQAAICHHTCRTADRMAAFVRRTDARGSLQLDSLGDLRDYCYAVAGIVGEMLTDLFLLNTPGLASQASLLRRDAPLFGEGLQLVNILRDASADGLEGRSYLPAAVARADLFALAREDLQVAREYTDALRVGGAPSGVIAFTTLPVELAFATLDTVEAEGPGARITRAKVGEILGRVLGISPEAVGFGASRSG